MICGGASSRKDEREVELLDAVPLRLLRGRTAEGDIEELRTPTDLEAGLVARACQLVQARPVCLARARTPRSASRSPPRPPQETFPDPSTGWRLTSWWWRLRYRNVATDGWQDRNSTPS